MELLANPPSQQAGKWLAILQKPENEPLAASFEVRPSNGFI
jgi:hypothetical protein